MRKILVLGANGYIGQALVEGLESNESNEVIKVVRAVANEVGYRNNTHHVNTSNLKEYAEAMVELMATESPDVVVNLVWAGSTGDARNDVALQNANRDFTIELCHHANAMDIKYVSLGTVSELEFEEPMAYALAKKEIHEALQDMPNFVWLRLANVIGGNDQTGRFVVNQIGKLLNDEDVNLNNNGDHVFNACYIDEAIMQIQFAIQSLDSGTFGVGAPMEKQTLREFLDELKIVTESKGSINYGDLLLSGFDYEQFSTLYNLARASKNKYSLHNRNPRNGFHLKSTLEKCVEDYKKYNK